MLDRSVKILKDDSDQLSKLSAPLKKVINAGRLGSPEWRNAVKAIKEGKGKGVNVKVGTKEEAEQMIKEARPDLVEKAKYTKEDYKAGYEIHPADNDYNMPHIKWKDWRSGKSNGADGHIFWEEK